MTVAAEDPKVAALAASRSLNPHPEKVTDEVFLASPFCDPRCEWVVWWRWLGVSGWSGMWRCAGVCRSWVVV